MIRTLNSPFFAAHSLRSVHLGKLFSGLRVPRDDLATEAERDHEVVGRVQAFDFVLVAVQRNRDRLVNRLNLDLDLRSAGLDFMTHNRQVNCLNLDLDFRSAGLDFMTHNRQVNRLNLDYKTLLFESQKAAAL
jgi:hypothetical protein